MKNDSLGQLIMIGVPGKELDAETAQLFRRVQPGAFILFGRNLENAAQLRESLSTICATSARPNRSLPSIRKAVAFRDYAGSAANVTNCNNCARRVM